MNLKNKITGIVLVSIALFLLLFGFLENRKIERKKSENLLQNTIADASSDLNEILLSQVSLYSFFTKNNSPIVNIERKENEKAILIYRFSKYMCEGCVNEDILELLDFQEDFGKNRIWILPAAYEDTRNDRILLNSLLHDFNYRNIPEDSLVIPFNEEGAKRYFAVINETGNMEMIFFPQRGNTKLTQMYFSEIKKQYPILN
jgi:hypothetical protein